jgi:hypothetical protein
MVLKLFKNPPLGGLATWGGVWAKTDHRKSRIVKLIIKPSMWMWKEK